MKLWKSSRSKVNVISTPNVTVMDNRTAMLQVGDQVPIQASTSQSVSTAGAPILSSIQMIDTGVILSVERSIRGLALSRKNALFAGHDLDAENWATIAPPSWKRAS